MRRIALLIGVLTALCGCSTVKKIMTLGYTSKPLGPADVRSVHLPVFDNRTFRRGLEFQLTEAIKTELLHKSDLRIVDRDVADTELTGEIVDVRENVLLEDLNDDVVETSITVTVDVIWRDRRSGRVLLDRRGVSDTAELIALRGENVGTATEEAFRDLAERIVELLEEDW